MNDNEYNQVHLNGNIIKILWRQQQELLKKSPEYVTPIINNEDPLDIQIDLEGPKATPYEGGIFRVGLLWKERAEACIVTVARMDDLERVYQYLDEGVPCDSLTAIFDRDSLTMVFAHHGKYQRGDNHFGGRNGGERV